MVISSNPQTGSPAIISPKHDLSGGNLQIIQPNNANTTKDDTNSLPFNNDIVEDKLQHTTIHADSKPTKSTEAYSNVLIDGNGISHVIDPNNQNIEVDIEEPPHSIIASTQEAREAANQSKLYAISAENSKDDAEAAKQSIDDMSATATVDGNVGTPYVVVTKTTIDNHENLDFAFHNVKGEGSEVSQNVVHYFTDAGKTESEKQIARNNIGAIDSSALSPYRTSTAQDIIDLSKQDLLISGENIKTINNTSILGAGNINSDLSYVHTQAVATSNWVVTHNLNKYPSVTVVDSANNCVVGDVNYPSLNSVTITFNGSFSGKAYLN